MGSEPTKFYPYTPSEILPIVAAVLVGLSLLGHIWQNLFVDLALLPKNFAKIIIATTVSGE